MTDETLASSFLPAAFNETTVTKANWQSLPGRQPPFEDLTVMVLTDAIDSVARIWLRVWRKYAQWGEKKIEPPGEI